MRKTLAMLLAAAMLFALCACGGKEEPAPAPVTPTPAPAEPAAPAETPEADPVSTQLIDLFNNICMLKTNPEYGKYWYCITDLDHNGRLEVTGAVTRGTGGNTTALMYEVGEDLRTLREVDLRLVEGEFLPEIIKSQAETYHVAANDSWHYVFFDTGSVGSGAELSGSEEYVALASKHFGLEPTTTCLTLSGVPIGMNGYAVYAEFYGTSTVQSARAYMTVNQVEMATVSANANSGYVFGNLWNTVNLYSSNGAQIHYECIKGGDTGPYESGTINSGDGINIVGIEGMYINVEVYANVIGSDKVAYYSFGVERTPAPPIEYTEYGTVTGDNFAEVFITTDSGTHYIAKDACMFGGTGYPSVGDSASLTFRNGEPLIAVINCTGDRIYY